MSEMQNGLISVIIPIWKPNLSHLKTCIDSVVAQTYSDIEIIIIYKKSPEFDEDFYRLIKEYQDDKIEVVEDDGALPFYSLSINSLTQHNPIQDYANSSTSKEQDIQNPYFSENC